MSSGRTLVPVRSANALIRILTVLISQRAIEAKTERQSQALF